MDVEITILLRTVTVRVPFLNFPTFGEGKYNSTRPVELPASEEYWPGSKDCLGVGKSENRVDFSTVKDETFAGGPCAQAIVPRTSARKLRIARFIILNAIIGGNLGNSRNLPVRLYILRHRGWYFLKTIAG